MAAELSRATGRPVEFVDVPDEDAEQGMIAAGMPEFVAAQLVNVFAMLRQGVAEQVTDTVESLAGKPPRDFGAFARDHARLFEPAAVAGGR